MEGRTVLLRSWGHHPMMGRPRRPERYCAGMVEWMGGWRPWRTPSPLAGRRPTRNEMSAALDSEAGRQDVLPFLTDAASAGRVRLLSVGINPSPWTAAVNAPFARPGNRFWASLARAGILPETIDASRGLSPEAERLLASRGLAITNLVSRPTARAAELH